MAEVHSKKATQANLASQAIEKAKAERGKAEAAAAKAEQEAINKALKTHSDNVVAK